MPPPTDFSDLNSAYNAGAGTFLNVIGVVVDLMAPTTTRTKEWVMTFKLLDPKLRDAAFGYQGLTVRYFKKDHQHLPRVQSLGDVVLIRNIKASPFNGQPLLVSNYQTSTVVFPAASIPDQEFSLGLDRMQCLGAPIDKEKVTLDHRAYAFALKNDMQETVAGLPSTNMVGFGVSSTAPSAPVEPPNKRPRLDQHPLPARPPVAVPDIAPTAPERQPFQSSFGPKFKLIKDLAHYAFADLCVQVVKKYHGSYGYDLYVTDYTSNKDMWYYPPPEADPDAGRDGDVFGYAGSLTKREFPGPYEFKVLKINVKEPHASFLTQKVTEGDFILLRNVKMKIRSEGAKLEGDMWPDSINPEKVQVRKLMNHDLPEIEAVRQRKEKYWASRGTKLQKQEAAQMTKTERKKIKKQKKAEKKDEEKAAQVAAQEARQRGQAKPDINPHVRCSSDEVTVTSVKAILDPDNARHINTPPGGESYVIPFINAKHRARVRVADYEPRTLEDFAIPADPEELRSSNSIDGMDWQVSQRWIWSFRLLLEDASIVQKADAERVWVNFHHDSAQYLLGNNVDDPVDLRSDAALLAKLREKLWILWGDLEEKRRDATDGEDHAGEVSNRPFECCLYEYGVPLEESDGLGEEVQGVGFGFRRMYAAFGVTIS